MPEKPPRFFSHASNRPVLAYLTDKSAHSDVAAALAGAVKQLGDVQLFCPDWQQYRFVAASTRELIFGFALEMNLVAFRLDGRLKDRALASGGVSLPECGDAWVAFTLFRSDWPRVDVEFWALKAYVNARTLAL